MNRDIASYFNKRDSNSGERFVPRFSLLPGAVETVESSGDKVLKSLYEKCLSLRFRMQSEQFRGEKELIEAGIGPGVLEPENL